MFFRNLTLFRFNPAALAPFFQPGEVHGDASFELTPPVFVQGLESCALKPVGPLELARTGFVAPYGNDSEQLAVEFDQYRWVALGQEKKLLSSAALNKATTDRIRAAEERLGLKLGGRQRKRFKQEALEEMLPKAFVEPRRTDAYLDLGRGFLAVDTSSRKAGEAVASQLREALGTFPALPLNAEVAPRVVLTGWLAGEALPDGFTLGDECELRDVASSGAVVKMQRKDLVGEEIEQHLQNGMQCTRLALTYRDHVSFVLGEDLVLRKVRILDGAVQQLEADEFDTVKQELDARFVVMAGTFGELFDALEKALQLSSAAPAPETAAAKPAPRKTAKTAKQPAPLLGIETVTISVQGMPSVTLSADEFSRIGDLTEKLDEVAQVIRLTGKTSISYWQRQLKCGYNQAARLLEFMESAGVVSPAAADGTRTVLQPQGSACSA